MPDTDTMAVFGREALESLVRREEDPFVADLRRRAFDEFEALPVPSPETEEWRYTDLRRFDLSTFVPVDVDTASRELDPEARAELDRQGVVFEGIDEALRTHPELIRPHLHRSVPTARSRFTALHGAFRTGGTFVHVPDGVRVEVPLQAITSVERDGTAVFPHTIIVTGRDAELTFVERYRSPALEHVLSDAVVEIDAGRGSRVRYVAVQEWGAGVTHLAVQRATLAQDAELRSLGVAFGASLSRSEVESVLEGDGSSSEMLGVYFANGDQHFDHRSIQDHIGSLTSSDLLYKGALRGSSRTIYSGTVIIRQGAHKCNAYQTNRNVLLSEEARADSIPNLEILSNDPVRCGHAASVGPVDDDALFYIQSRGIPDAEAERLVVMGFFQEVLDRVSIPEVRGELERAIARELERGS
jgi:Fe-S cluster assembly protein SufD